MVLIMIEGERKPIAGILHQCVRCSECKELFWTSRFEPTPRPKCRDCDGHRPMPHSGVADTAVKSDIRYNGGDVP